jgi:hypothetical protein
MTKSRAPNDPVGRWAVQIKFPRGGTYWPMQWGGLQHFTDDPAAASDYTERGAKAVATRLRRQRPGIADWVSVVPHPHPTGGWLCH